MRKDQCFRNGQNGQKFNDPLVMLQLFSSAHEINEIMTAIGADDEV